MRTRDAAKRRERLVAFEHHGDGKIAVSCKVPSGMHTLLAEADPERFLVPPYLGPEGWIALRLDTEKVDWKEVCELVGGSYRLIAPKNLTKQEKSP